MAPRRLSRAARAKALTLTGDHLRLKLADLEAYGAPAHDVKRLKKRADEVAEDRARLGAEGREAAAFAKAINRNRSGQHKDKMAAMVGRSNDLTEWHYRVANALAASFEVSLGGGSSMASGTAGDGDGGAVMARDGVTERGEAHYGAFGVPVASGADPLAGFSVGRGTADKLGRVRLPPKTFKPKAVKDARRVSDGGMAAMADARQRGHAIWARFMDVADAEGLAVCGRAGCGKACRAVILGDMGKAMAFTRFVRGTKVTGHDGIEAAMIAGLEAVSRSLGFDH